jgi:gamma-glutamyltranspeptidase/glutathione hydrolase
VPLIGYTFPVIEARRFPRACVASPHYLASSVGLATLATGGNALDAAVATNLTLGVVAPYLCGYGGDLFAMLWRDGELTAYNGSGRAPQAATVDAVRTAVGSDDMPVLGPHTVTVPGAVRGWFDLLERFGTRSFGNLAEPALRYARDGFALTEAGGGSLRRAQEIFVDFDEWQRVYGSARPGGVLRQPGLARSIEAVTKDGPDAYYRGPIGLAIAEHLRSLGAFMDPADFAAHRGDWVRPLATGYRGVEVLELPPNSQGVAALEALNIVEAAGALPPEGVERQHLLIEAIKLALADRNEYVTDPEHMDLPAETLASPEWGADRARAIEHDRAARPQPGRKAVGGTIYLCAADGDGMLVSLIQSNYAGFGSGVTVPEWGINLQNRGASFSLDPAHVNAIGARKRTMHTLMPAMARRDDRPWLVFGTMGGDGQAQTHLQLLTRIIDDGEDLQRAVAAPRWVVSPADWSVTAEGRFSADVLEGLRGRGHALTVTGDHDSLLGHAHAIRIAEHGYEGATDPRAEGAVLGL